MANSGAPATEILEKRIALFERIQAMQRDEILAKGGEPIKITMLDGAVKEGKKWLTSPMDVAREISKGLATNALIAEVDGMLWDMTRPLEGDCKLQIFQFDSDKGRDTFWHSSAHVLGQVFVSPKMCHISEALLLEI
jgi:threonyl-tRNA synthetase